MTSTLENLFEIIKERKNANPQVSYTAKLFAKGRNKIAQKVGEEGVEVVIAALAEGNERLVEESADLLYNLLVLLADCGVNLSDVEQELEKRMKAK